MGLRDSIKQITPSWLNGFVGTRYLYMMAVTLDAVWEKARQGVLARFPTRAPPSALSSLGADRLLERGFDEPDDSYGKRLTSFRRLVRVAGNPATMLEVLWGYFIPHFDFIHTVQTVKIVSDSSWWWTLDAFPDGFLIALANRAAPVNWNWDGGAFGSPPTWSRAWVIVRMLDSVWGPEGLWSDPGDWDDGGVWDTNATQAQIGGLRAVVRNWKPANTIVEIILSFNDALFPVSAAYPDPNLPNGTWDRWENRAAGASYLGPV